MLSRCGPLSTEQPHCCLKRYSCDCAAATVSRVITMGQESLGSSAGIVTIQTTQPILTSPHRPTWDLGSGPETPDPGPGSLWIWTWCLSDRFEDARHQYRVTGLYSAEVGNASSLSPVSSRHDKGNLSPAPHSAPLLARHSWFNILVNVWGEMILSPDCPGDC